MIECFPTGVNNKRRMYNITNCTQHFTEDTGSSRQGNCFLNPNKIVIKETKISGTHNVIVCI